MSTTRYIKLSGTCFWPRLVKPDSKYSKWGIDLYLDKKSKKVFDDSGLQLSIRSNEDGEYIKLSRPTQKVFGKKVQEFDPPEVVNKDGNPMDPYTIGNGSEVIAEVCVYDTVKGKGHRLEKVIVTKLLAREPQRTE